MNTDQLHVCPLVPRIRVPIRRLRFRVLSAFPALADQRYPRSSAAEDFTCVRVHSAAGDRAFFRARPTCKQMNADRVSRGRTLMNTDQLHVCPLVPRIRVPIRRLRSAFCPHFRRLRISVYPRPSAAEDSTFVRVYPRLVIGRFSVLVRRAADKRGSG